MGLGCIPPATLLTLGPHTPLAHLEEGLSASIHWRMRVELFHLEIQPDSVISKGDQITQVCILGPEIAGGCLELARNSRGGRGRA